MKNPTKPYELTLDERPEYLYAHLTSEATDLSTAVDYWQKLIAKCHKLKGQRLLVLQEIPGGLSSADTFFLASKVTEMGISRIKVASRKAQIITALLLARLIK